MHSLSLTEHGCDVNRSSEVHAESVIKDLKNEISRKCLIKKKWKNLYFFHYKVVLSIGCFVGLIAILKCTHSKCMH